MASLQCQKTIEKGLGQGYYGGGSSWGSQATKMENKYQNGYAMSYSEHERHSQIRCPTYGMSESYTTYGQSHGTHNGNAMSKPQFHGHGNGYGSHMSNGMAHTQAYGSNHHNSPGKHQGPGYGSGFGGYPPKNHGMPHSPPHHDSFTSVVSRRKRMATTVDSGNQYDRAEEVKRFDDSKIGVKGLVDSGLTTIPRIFLHPPETLSDLKPKPKPKSVAIPTIDLSGPRSTVVEQVAAASRSFGFFQIVNHGIPVQVLDRMIASIRAFHELPTDVKARFYRRDAGTGVSFISNVDLFHSKAASWRDTLQIRLGPTLPELEHIPEVCRDEVVQWNLHSTTLGEQLMGLLSEGLGLDKDTIKNTTCLDARVMVGHYYPCCPQPDLTVGIASHTDPGVLTLLQQDHTGGLQIKHEGEWVDVKPVHGALVINIADILQIMSNDEYKSVEHRVLANPSEEARVSIAVFFNPSAREALYGPFAELTSPEKPAHYRQFIYNDYMRRFFTKELDGKTLTNFYKL